MRRGSSRGGFILIAVLVIVILASMVALSLMFRMRAEQAGAAAGRGGELAWNAAWSGVEQAIQVASNPGEEGSSWQDNPAAFRHRLVSDDGGERWYYTVFTWPHADSAEPVNGLTDEASRINLNVAEPAWLQEGLGWTNLWVAAVTGVASQTSTNDSAIGSTNSPSAGPGGSSRRVFATFEELLTLPEFTMEALYGEDANRNFKLDPNEDDGEESMPLDDKDGLLHAGIRPDVTVYSRERNVSNAGARRIQLNSRDKTWSIPELPDHVVDYIHRFQESDKILSHPADLLEAKDKFKNAAGVEEEIESGVGPDELAVILDHFTCSTDDWISGLVNINTAPARVLKCLPGLDEDKAADIVEKRVNLPEDLKNSTAWLVREKVLTADEFKRAAPHLTTRSLQFSFHVAGYALPTGRLRVFEVVIDLADTKPAIRYLQEITRLGLPFAPPAGDDQETNVKNKPES